MENNQNVSNQSLDQIMAELTGDTPTVEQPGAPAPIIETTTTDPITVEEPIEVDEATQKFFSLMDEKVFKTNKLAAFNNEDNSDYIVPKNLDEFVEVLEANKNQWIADSKYAQKEELLADIFKETTPAFQYLVQNSNMYKTVEDMIPLAQAVQAQDDFAGLDLEDATHQEFIVGTALTIQGLSEAEVIEEIKDLKERGKLESRATTLKPVVDRVQAEKTESILAEQHAKNQADQTFWNNYYKGLNEQLIDAKDLDGMVLTAADRVKVAINLVPAEDGSGLPIYEKIDKLIGAGDLKTLSIISMLLEDRQVFDSYYANKTHAAAGLASARTLRNNVVSTSTEEDVTQQIQSGKSKEVASTYGNFMQQ